jgi:hypothetical protein
MTTTKTIAVSEVVWQRLKEIMKREQAKRRWMTLTDQRAKILNPNARLPANQVEK